MAWHLRRLPYLILGNTGSNLRATLSGLYNLAQVGSPFSYLAYQLTLHDEEHLKGSHGIMAFLSMDTSIFLPVLSVSAVRLRTLGSLDYSAARAPPVHTSR